MRKVLIASSYIFCAAVYTTFSIAIYQMLRETIYDTQVLTMINKAMMVAFGAIAVEIPLLLFSKKNRNRFMDSIAAVVDEFIVEIIEPLKKNIKRKAFWILQGYTLTRILTWVNNYVLLVFFVPVCLFSLDSSKEVGNFVVNFIALMILVDIVKMVASVLQTDWRRLLKIILHVIVLGSADTFVEIIYSTEINDITVQASSIGPSDWTILALVIVYLVSLHCASKWILNDIEKDLSIDQNLYYQKPLSDDPIYSFSKYSDLIKIDSIDFHYYGFDDLRPYCRVAFIGHLRYGLLQFEKKERLPEYILDQDAMPMKDSGKCSNEFFEDK